MKAILLCVISACSMSTVAQKGNVAVKKDPRIDVLVEEQGKIVPPAIHPQIDGYRVQLFFDSDRSKLDDARATFIAKYPMIDTYTTYNAPNFFLRIGDFRTELEAEKVKIEIEHLFPTSFIVREKINLPRLSRELNN